MCIVACIGRRKDSRVGKVSMPASAPSVLTVGEIIRRLNAPLHRVQYVIQTRDIQPVGRAGNVRIFSEADVSFIASELRRIDEERGVGHAE